jgi:hypothetical protein
MSDNDTIEPVRDEALGELLRGLDVPPHRPAFMFELRRRVQEERRAARRRRTVRWSLRVGAAAAVAAVLLFAVGLPRTGEDGPTEPAGARAAVVKAHVRAALRSLRTLSGVLVVDDPSRGGSGRWTFALDARGDLRLEGPRPGDATTYDARSGVVRSAQHSAAMGGPGLFYAERRGVAPGPPDPGPPAWVLPEQYGAFVRAAVGDAPATVHMVEYQSRPAWRLDVETPPNTLAPSLSGDHLQLTVDRASGLPLQVVETKAGAVLRELRIENLAVGPRLPRSTFRLAFPKGAEVMPMDDGFRRVSLDAVSSVVGYAPLVPSWLPPGYRLAAVAVARHAAAVGSSGSLPSDMVVSLSYRRGIDQLLVTTRLRGDAGWVDPLASPEGFHDTPRAVRMSTGALAGIDGQLVLSPTTQPHLWALTDSLVVTVGGDAGAEELTRIAGSLQPR